MRKLLTLATLGLTLAAGAAPALAADNILDQQLEGRYHRDWDRDGDYNRGRDWDRGRDDWRWRRGHRCLDRQDIYRRVYGFGYRRIFDVDYRGNFYLVRALDYRGSFFALTIDAYDGRLLRVVYIGNDRGPYGGRW